MAIVQSDGALVTTPASLATRFTGGGWAGGGALEWWNGRVSDYAAIYRTQPNVRLVINFLARNMAQLGLDPFERISDTERRSLGGSSLGKFIRIPNPGIRLTKYRFIHTLVSDLKLYDISFFLKTKNDSGELRLWRLPPYLMEPGDSNLWMANTWKFLGLASQPVFNAEDLFIVNGYNPDDMRFGLSPIESIRQMLREGQAASDYREQFWKSGARISGVIERPASGQGTPKWSEKAKERFLAEWNSSFSGNAAGAGGTPLLEDGMQFKEVAFSAKDAEYIAARKLGREEVAAMYHVSPLFVGILENANFSNVKEQHRHLYQDTLGPDLVMLEEDFHLQIVSEFVDVPLGTTYLEFDLKDKLRGSFEEEAAARQAAVGGPWQTRNEARAEENKPPIEGGDELITPLNVLIGGQASPQDSAPGTASFPYYVALDQLAKQSAGAVGTGRKAFTKDADELPDDVKEWFDQHVDILTAFFERQSSSVRSRLGSNPDIETAWETSRWDTELRDDLLDLARPMTEELGKAHAEAFGGEFDPEAPGVNELLEENARIAAENVNNATKTQIADLDSGDDFMDKVANIFAVAASSRAAQIAITRVTGVGNFARKEGAQQGGATKKVWNVRSTNSRHPGMNGEKVDIDSEFSNGARWPGDASLNDDQRSGCVCSLDFE